MVLGCEHFDQCRLRFALPSLTSLRPLFAVPLVTACGIFIDFSTSFQLATPQSIPSSTGETPTSEPVLPSVWSGTSEVVIGEPLANSSLTSVAVLSGTDATIQNNRTQPNNANSAFDIAEYVLPIGLNRITGAAGGQGG